MAGILSAVKLREAGFDEVTVYEKADRVGGTWRENRYPGVACDVPSHLYSYSFELNPQWSHLFSPGDEIQKYFESVSSKYGVEEMTRFGDEVIECEWLERGCWQIRTRSGHDAEVDVIIAATGVLHHPSKPEIEGMDDFGGSMFHSARWDHDLDLDNARVGVIGTGSTATQITSALAGNVAHFDLFQRTAQWILPQENPAYDESQRAAFADDPKSLEDIHQQFSTIFAEGFADAVVDADSPQIHLIADACLSNLEENVPDGELKESLRPDYVAACKRLVVSPDFYEAIQRPRTSLVTSGIDRIEKNGIRTVDGVLHELDVIVFATGFQADAFMRPMNVIGRNGIELAEVWTDRPNAYLSISIPEFPNLFMLNGPNGPVGNFSLIEVAELQFDYIFQLIQCLDSGDATEVSADPAATRSFEADRVEAAKSTVWVTGCRSWYLDDRGIPSAWPWKFSRFQEEMAAPNMDHWDVRSPT